MELKHIKYTCCPECGSEIVETRLDVLDGKIQMHASGRRWEHIRFACGRANVYIPITNCIVGEAACHESAEYKAERAQVNEAKLKLDKFLSELEIGDDFKELVRNSVRDV
jgi:hypothetical protein